MKIELLKDREWCDSEVRKHKKGETVEVADFLGKQWIANGTAKEAKKGK